MRALYFKGLLKMNKILAAAFLLLCLSNPAHAEFQQAWKDCDTKEDCVITRDACDNAIAVNRLFLNAAEEDRRTMAPRVNCASTGPKDISFYGAICEYDEGPCYKKNWLGRETGEIDPASTCISSS